MVVWQVELHMVMMTKPLKIIPYKFLPEVCPTANQIDLKWHSLTDNRPLDVKFVSYSF
jgi:hypothetical protein